MQILQVCPYALDVPGGVQDQARGLAKHFERRGHHVRLIGPSHGAGRVVRVAANGSMAPIAVTPGAWQRVTAAAKGADIVHVHEPLMPVVGWGGLAQSAPKVLTFHADPSMAIRTLYRGGRRLVRRRLRAAAVVAVSEVAASAVRQLGIEPDIIPNGVNVRHDPVPVDSRRVVFVGRDEPRKGLDVLLEAFRHVTVTHPAARLVVIGTNRPSSRGVEFLGRVDATTKRATLEAAGVLCAPNLGGESFGIVVAEGMAAGCAIVASDLPAFRAVAGADAVFVEPGDPAALAAALDELLADPDRIETLGAAARRAAVRFDWEAVTDAYEDLYDMTRRRAGA